MPFEVYRERNGDWRWMPSPEPDPVIVIFEDADGCPTLVTKTFMSLGQAREWVEEGGALVGFSNPRTFIRRGL